MASYAAIAKTKHCGCNASMPLPALTKLPVWSEGF